MSSDPFLADPAVHRPVAPMIRSSALVAISMGATQLLLLGVALASSRSLGPDGRGTLVLFLAVGSMTGIVAGLGTHISARIHLVSPDDHVPLSDFLGLTLALTGFELVLCMATAAIAFPLTHVESGPTALLLASAYGASLLLAIFLSQALYGCGQGVLAAATEACATLLQLVAIVTLAALGDHDVFHYILAMMVGELAQAIMAAAVILHLYPSTRMTASLPRWRLLIRVGVPLLFMGVSQGLSLRLDRFMTGFYLSPGQVGIYSVAATVTEALWLAPVALAQVLFHLTASASLGPQQLQRLRRYSLGLSLCLAVIIFLLAPVGIRITFGSRFTGAVTSLRILLIGAVALASYYVDNAVLAARGAIWAAGTAAAIGMAVVSVGDFLLIPRYGITGAAWASDVGYTVMAIASKLLLDRDLVR